MRLYCVNTEFEQTVVFARPQVKVEFLPDHSFFSTNTTFLVKGLYTLFLCL